MSGASEALMLTVYQTTFEEKILVPAILIFFLRQTPTAFCELIEMVFWGRMGFLTDQERVLDF